MSFEGHERVDLHTLGLQLRRTAQFRQVDDEGCGHDFAARLADQVDGGPRRAAGGNQIIDQQNAVAFLNGVGVDLDRVDAVFQLRIPGRSLCVAACLSCGWE